MIKTILPLALLLVSQQVSAGEEAIRMNGALKDFRAKYMTAEMHRAFAQSPDGAWGWATGRTSVQVASEDAVLACAKSLKAGERPCVVIHVDDAWFPR